MILNCDKGAAMRLSQKGQTDYVIEINNLPRLRRRLACYLYINYLSSYC